MILLTITQVLDFRGMHCSKSGVEFELLTGYDQHLFIKKGMRAGILMVSKFFARANNPFV